jgi:hypothetical protein
MNVCTVYIRHFVNVANFTFVVHCIISYVLCSVYMKSNTLLGVIRVGADCLDKALSQGKFTYLELGLSRQGKLTYCRTSDLNNLL